MRFLPLFLAASVGCSPAVTGFPTNPAPPPPPSEPGTAFDPAACGTITGRVTWGGDVPDVPTLDLAIRSGLAPNPFAPAVDPVSRGLGGAVVFVKNLDPARGKPWDLPAVRVEITGAAVHVIPGGRVGFVKRGAEVPMASAEAGHRMLRARGAAYFTLPFPDAGQPIARTFDRPGIVELTSGSGEFWTAADVFVCDHPYFTVTATDGSFALPQVPAGTWELGVWVRNWHVSGQDRDPESGIVSRVRYAAPVGKAATVTVAANAAAAVDVPLTAVDFPTQ
ncbi:MAG: hypothetical protein ACRC7O_12940 [Fimbriiglobus sp.]